MKKLSRLLWRLTKNLSVVVGVLCFIGATCQAVINGEENTARAVRVGMTRPQVETQLRGWHQGNTHALFVTPQKGQTGWGYRVCYRGNVWRNYITYDRNDRVAACQVYDGM